jgi:hypothetical protein
MGSWWMSAPSGWFDRIGWRIALWLAVIVAVGVWLSP